MIGEHLRSELVFVALNRISNPFLLCHTVRLRARLSLHRSNDLPSAINHELKQCRRTDTEAPKGKPELALAEPLVFTASVLAE
jgi:hypothetical protein